MKKYILKEDCSMGNIIITKGTKVIDKNNYIDNDGGVEGIITNGKYKGIQIIFNISELEERL